MIKFLVITILSVQGQNLEVVEKSYKSLHACNVKASQVEWQIKQNPLQGAELVDVVCRVSMPKKLDA